MKTHIIPAAASLLLAAYDRGSIAGRLERGLDEAKSRGWTVVDMAKDWARVFASEARPIQ
jgi:hypothetical protein